MHLNLKSEDYQSDSTTPTPQHLVLGPEAEAGKYLRLLGVGLSM